MAFSWDSQLPVYRAPEEGSRVGSGGNSQGSHVQRRTERTGLSKHFSWWVGLLPMYTS